MDLPSLVPVDQMTAAAQWLNSFFATFDSKILEFYYSLHCSSAGKFFDIFNEAFTRLGDDGILLILIALVLMLFKKSRKVGMGMLGGIVIGALFTNITIKNVVARPRPYCTTEFFRNCWLDVGHGLESEFSFPSGHTTSAAAAMMPVFLGCNKKKSWLAFLFVIVLGATRNYIFVHFPSDVLGGMIVGSIAGLLAYIIVNILYDKIFIKGKLGNIITTKNVTDLFQT